MPRSLSAEQVEEFRARLCAVAQHRFATEGRDAVSMRQLADALGCSPMTPYRYFHNKDEILAAVRTAAFDRFAEALEQAAAQAGGDLRVAGQAVGEAYVRFALGDPDGYRLMFDLTQPHPDRYPELVRASTRARRTMSAALERLVRAGVFHGDPELLGFAFWAGMHGLVMLHLAGKLPAERDFETIRRELMRLLVTGARAAA
ncbi:MAG TPA: TetR/AcrR family transcriptional regulator [Candidatus Dormibacteraeota bacterium]|nr:TetR/AcrR family transcriptional regulator [Candidatus Dormibacteraeota bacterium]